MPHSMSRVRVTAGGFAAVALATAVLLPAAPTGAVTSVPAGNGATWQVHDAAPPGLDTGSIRAVSNAPVEGFGNIFVRVTGPAGAAEPRLNGEMMRGFGLTFDGVDTFESTRSVQLGDVRIAREVTVDGPDAWARFFDTFTNTGRAPVTVEVSFGGSLGYGAAQNQGAIRSTSSGDAVVDEQDAWTLAATPNPAQRPVGVVLGTPGAAVPLDRTGNQQRDPFETPMATAGHEANFQGYVSTFTVRPRETLSLARFVTVGATGTGSQAAAATQLTELAAKPDLAGLTTLERCTLRNWDRSLLGVARCPSTPVLATPSPGPQAAAYTTSSYDVVNASIDQLLRDLDAGVTTSAEITRAYLDRIAVYDGGPLGYHAFIDVADDAMAQARAADRARARGETGELLGVPIAIKDLYDTKDMPTTGGTLALEGWQPETDAYQVERLRDAGAVIIGKANLSEFANSGGYSESGWGQVWNALYPSKTSFGSSGGSAVAVSASMAAGALGSQTGVSLYAPSTGNSMTTFRGTDGMASLRGIMPLSWAQDYGGPIARTVTDLAHLLNATTGTDPLDPLTAEADAHRPADWTAHLDAGALAGLRIGYLPSSFVSSYADDGTGAAVLAHFADLEAAGATMVELGAPPSGGPSPAGSRSEEGWARYIELHDDFPYADGDALLSSPLVLPYNQRALRDTPRMTPEQVDAWLAYRAQYKETIAGWMDAADVDAVVYPGFISDMYNNDASGNQLTADRGTGVLTSNVGLPTVVVPVGTSPHGYSISMQLVGRAWDDAAILGMGYALEQQTKGQQVPGDAPPLEYRPGARPHAVPQIAPLVPGRSPSAAGLRGFGPIGPGAENPQNDG